VNDSSTDPSGLSTGDEHVDRALTRLDELDGADLDQHVEIYDDVQRSLGSVLDGHETSEYRAEPAGEATGE
jgi:hypothetical protein